MTREPQNLFASCDSFCNTNSEKIHFRTSEPDTDFLNPWNCTNEALSKCCFEVMLSGETLSGLQSFCYRSQYLRMIMPENCRTHPRRIVNVLITVNIPYKRTKGASKSQRDRTSNKSNIGVNPTRNRRS